MKKNFQNWSEKTLSEKVSAGTIKGFSIQQPEKHSQPNGRKVVKHFKKRSKEKDWIGWNLLVWCQERNYELVEEFRFHEVRKWRFDYCIPEIMAAIEYEGLMSEKSGHTTVGGYSKDTEKYNAAGAAGWRVLRYTALTYKEMIDQLNNLVK
jgi:hypothetical protein